MLLERGFAVRPDPFRDCAVPELEVLEFVRLLPVAEPVRAVFAVLRAVRGFGAWARLLAEPVLAARVRDAGFDAAVLEERFAVLLRVLSRDRFVVAMSPSPTM